MRAPLYWLARWLVGGAKGTLFPLDANAEETPLTVGSDGKVLTADTAADGGMSWQTPGTSSGGVDPSVVTGVAGIVASKAPLLSPRFLGTPTKNGVALATTADIPTVPASADPSEMAGLRGQLAAAAPLLSPRFIGTPTKNGVALATTADIPASVSLDGVNADLSGLRGLDAAKAPLLSPQFIGTPRANALPLATQAYVDAATAALTYDSAQVILASQIFGS